MLHTSCVFWFFFRVCDISVSTTGKLQVTRSLGHLCNNSANLYSVLQNIQWWLGTQALPPDSPLTRFTNSGLNIYTLSQYWRNASGGRSLEAEFESLPISGRFAVDLDDFQWREHGTKIYTFTRSLVCISQNSFLEVSVWTGGLMETSTLGVEQLLNGMMITHRTQVTWWMEYPVVWSGMGRFWFHCPLSHVA